MPLGRSLRALLPAVSILTVGCVTVPPVRSVEHPPVPRLELPAQVRVRTSGRVVSVPLEDYVLIAALSEVSPVGDSTGTVATILEVQTVLARTYASSNLRRHAAEGFDLCDGTHCQLYQPGRLAASRFIAAARAAVATTRGQILTFGTRPAQATFHADCGGHTVSAAAIWTGLPLAYLTGAPDDAPDVVHQSWQFTASAGDLRRAINLDSASAVGSHLTSVRVAGRDSSGRALRVELAGPTTRAISGEKFRAVVNAAFGVKALQSTRFTVTTTGLDFRFDGTGFGHGVGLCQVGAAARARRGQSVDAILTTYFPGTRLTTASAPPAG